MVGQSNLRSLVKILDRKLPPLQNLPALLRFVLLSLFFVVFEVIPKINDGSLTSSCQVLWLR